MIWLIILNFFFLLQKRRQCWKVYLVILSRESWQPSWVLQVQGNLRFFVYLRDLCKNLENLVDINGCVTASVTLRLLISSYPTYVSSHIKFRWSRSSFPVILKTFLVQRTPLRCVTISNVFWFTKLVSVVAFGTHFLKQVWSSLVEILNLPILFINLSLFVFVL
jgi:hypothetical protein